MPTALLRSAADPHRRREAVESPGERPAPAAMPEKEEKVKKIMKPRVPRPKLTLELLEVGSDCLGAALLRGVATMPWNTLPVQGLPDQTRIQIPGAQGI